MWGQAGRVRRVNPVLVSALHGLLKGALNARVNPTAPIEGASFKHSLVGPIKEEIIYRALPLYFGSALSKRMPTGWTAVPFALEHVVQESARGLHQTTGSAFGRFADVFLGGVLYEKAFREWGILGAVAAHCLHNVCHDVGMRAARGAR